jgi:hypothetical protein
MGYICCKVGLKLNSVNLAFMVLKLYKSGDALEKSS